jgi:hypothetical protein
MTTHRFVPAIAAALALGAAAPAPAQLSLTPRALGMGGAYLAVARGQEALFLNPANLALAGSPHWSAGIPTLVIGATARGVSVGEFADLVRYQDADQARRNALIASIPATGTGAEVELRAPLLALQVRRLALGIGYSTIGSHTVNRSMAELVLTGFDPARAHSITNTEGFRAEYWDLAAAYGHRVGPVALGATVRYAIAGTMVRSGLVGIDTVGIAPAITDLRVTYAGVRTTGGGGFGLDLGAAMEPARGVTVGIAVENAFSNVAWDGERRLRTVVLDSNDYRDADPQTLLDRYTGSDRAYSGAEGGNGVHLLADRLETDRTAGLPTVVRAGAAYRMDTGTTLAAGYRAQVGTNSLAGAWPRHASVGVQQRIPLVTLRAGAGSDLGSATMLSGGLSLGPIQLGVARITRGGDDRREGWVGTFGLAGRSDSVMP